MRLLSTDDHAAKKLKAIRGQLTANARARDELRQARLTDAEIKNEVAAGLDDFIRGAKENLGSLAFAEDRSYPEPDALADALANNRYLVHLLRPVLEPAIVADVIASAGDAGTLSALERQAQLDHLAGERSKLEVDEEREVLRLEAAGYTVPRRADINAAVVVGVWNQDLQNDEAG